MPLLYGRPEHLTARQRAQARRSRLRRTVLGEGDALMVTRLDGLARSTRDLLNVLHEVAQSGAAFKSLHDHVPRTERHILEGTSYYNTGDVLSDTSRRKRRRPSRKIRLRCAAQRASST